MVADINTISDAPIAMDPLLLLLYITDKVAKTFYKNHFFILYYVLCKENSFI